MRIYEERNCDSATIRRSALFGAKKLADYSSQEDEGGEYVEAPPPSDNNSRSR